MNNSIQIFLFILFLNTVKVRAEIIVHDPPGNIKASTEYKIELIQDGKAIPSFVYIIYPQFRTNNSLTTSWTSFAFTGKITIRVTRLNERINFCQILPRSKDINPRIFENYIEFDIDKPGQYSVEFENGIYITHPMLVFANAPEINAPSKNAPNVIYFDRGVHNIGERYRLKSNQTVYIADGAYVKGKFVADSVENVKIIGRGILSCEDYYDLEGSHTISMRNADNILIEGITIIYSAHFNIVLLGNNHTVRNVKMLSWWFSSDGVSTGTNGIIEDCFFKVNDDALKLYGTNTIARNCVIWQLENGAPFQIGWNAFVHDSNFYINNIDVIRVEHQWDRPNEAIFCAIQGAGGGRKHYLFENIRIDNATWRIFYLTTQPNRWGAWNPKSGYVSDLTFRNIEVYTNPKMPNIIRGWDEYHKITNVRIENLKINGNLIDSPQSGNFLIYKPTTDGIEILTKQ